MRTLILTILTVLIISSLLIQEVKAQDPITEYDGIPLVIYPYRRADSMIVHYPNSLNQIKEMGVYGVVAPDILDNDEFIDSFANYNLKVVPQYLWGDTTKWYVWRYTNSHYSVWEAEGTDLSKGNATLYFDPDHTTYFNEGDTIEGRWAGGYDVPDNIALIYGPGYPQNATYNFIADTVRYAVEYQMKITERDPDLPEGYLNDVVCKILVTNRKDGGYPEDTLIIKEVRISEFNGWDNWATIDSIYDLREFIDIDEFVDSRGKAISNGSAYWVQFKVIWAGLDYVNLYIDKIKVYDEIGNQIVNNEVYQARVANLVQDYMNPQYRETVIGWYGTDEPGSIDNYEPYRIVDSIINAKSGGNLRLHAGFTGSWRGIIAFGDNSYGMAHDLFAAEEFWLRARPKNTQINIYIYHHP